MNFNELDIRPELLRAVEDMGYAEASPIQEAAIPVILEGRDMIGQAQTGTGKTAAFALPVLNTTKIRGKVIHIEKASMH